MDAALTLFAARGVAATPVTAIEEASGLIPGNGSFYRHFKDKAQLLAAVVDRELARVTKDPAAQFSQRDPGADPTEALARQLRSDLDFLRSLQPLMAILVWERGNAPEVSGQVHKLMVERGVELGVADLLASASSAAVQRDPAAAATVMMAAVVGYFLNVEFFGHPPAGIDPDRFSTMLAQLMTGGPRA